MNHPVAPAGDVKIALAELQGIKFKVITGAAADTPVEVPEMKYGDAVLAVIAIDGDNATLANTVVDLLASATFAARTADIEAITLTDGEAVAIEITGHGLITGEHIVFSDDVGGTTELRGKGFLVDVVDADNFTLRGTLFTTAGAEYTAFTSGGNIIAKDGVVSFGSDMSASRVLIVFCSKPNA